MEKTKQLNDLFLEWNDDSFTIFCEDGIVDEKKFDECKILFVLKDLHLDEKNEEKYKSIGKIDMRQHICDKEDWRTWNPIALWAKALLDSEVKDFTQIQSEISNKFELRNTYLPKIAFINLKKEAGKSSVENECVYCYSKKDLQHIRDEIKIINPDVIIACGTAVFGALDKIVFNDNRVDTDRKLVFNEKMRDYGYAFDVSESLDRDTPVYVVHYRHPVDYGKGSCTTEEHYNNMLVIRKRLLNK